MLWIIPSEAAAQKPAIVLIPSTFEHFHPEALIDTSLTNDSLINVIISHPKEMSVVENEQKKKETGFGLRFKKMNPIKFFIQFTALKYNL